MESCSVSIGQILDSSAFFGDCRDLAHTGLLSAWGRIDKHNPPYSVYAGMKKRCYSPESISYKYYGARGIRVCDRWMSSYKNFAEDMGPRPEGTTLERINNDGNYEPSNCRWATRSEQARNQRRPGKLTKPLAVSS